MKVIIAKVVLPFPIRQYFKYIIPDLMCPIVGGRVLVPFRSKYVVGIVISFCKKKEITQLNLKHIKKIIDKKSCYTSCLLDILIWISKNYHCPVGKLFFSVLPKILYHDYVLKDKILYKWIITKKGQNLDVFNLKRKKKQLYTLLFLKKNSVINSELKKYNLSKLVLEKLEKQGLCQKDVIYESSLIKKPFFKIKKNFFLNKKHSIFFENLLVNKKFSSWLLTKTNLYGKIKFYLSLIRLFLNQEIQILILVPYIKNISIIVIFLKKFFDVSIDVIHSELTKTQYLKNWIRTKNGENSIVIGTKKSIFLPFTKLGVIILLEEHHLNYKNIEKCAYNVRDIGILRAYREQIPIILDSETPSLKTLHNILLKKCLYIKINKYDYVRKINNSIIDLQKEKIRFGFSLTLINEINQNYKKKQVLLIADKKNFLFFVLQCDTCKWIFKCSNCQYYFESNQYHNVLLCRLCLIKIKRPLFCYNCGCLSLIIINLSIKEIKKIIQDIFPNQLMFFLLNKNNFNKNIFNKNLFDFTISTSCIIFTTEHIVNNYYFPHVKLIVLMCVDNYFSSLKFRNTEYFAQFYFNLIQLTKYKKIKPKILIQTSCLKNKILQKLCNNTYDDFANKTLLIRKKFFLPPWSSQIIIYSENTNSEKNIIFLNLIYKILKKKSIKYNISIWFVGPNLDFSSKTKKKNINY